MRQIRESLFGIFPMLKTLQQSPHRTLEFTAELMAERREERIEELQHFQKAWLENSFFFQNKSSESSPHRKARQASIRCAHCSSHSPYRFTAAEWHRMHWNSLFSNVHSSCSFPTLLLFTSTQWLFPKASTGYKQLQAGSSVFSVALSK